MLSFLITQFYGSRLVVVNSWNFEGLNKKSKKNAEVYDRVHFLWETQKPGIAG